MCGFLAAIHIFMQTIIISDTYTSNILNKPPTFPMLNVHSFTIQSKALFDISICARNLNSSLFALTGDNFICIYSGTFMQIYLIKSNSSTVYSRNSNTRSCVDFIISQNHQKCTRIYSQISITRSVGTSFTSSNNQKCKLMCTSDL